jgi:hypothetical protein
MEKTRVPFVRIKKEQLESMVAKIHLKSESDAGAIRIGIVRPLFWPKDGSDEFICDEVALILDPVALDRIIQENVPLSYYDRAVELLRAKLEVLKKEFIGCSEAAYEKWSQEYEVCEDFQL